MFFVVKFQGFPGSSGDPGTDGAPGGPGRKGKQNLFKCNNFSEIFLPINTFKQIIL